MNGILIKDTFKDNASNKINAKENRIPKKIQKHFMKMCETMLEYRIRIYNLFPKCEISRITVIIIQITSQNSSPLIFMCKTSRKVCTCLGKMNEKEEKKTITKKHY